jgi:hypothetical protein
MDINVIDVLIGQKGVDINMTKYYNCIHHVGSGKCVHPVRGDRKKGGSGICRFTSETEHKCPDYFGHDKYYSHSKGGKK